MIVARVDFYPIPKWIAYTIDSHEKKTIRLLSVNKFIIFLAILQTSLRAYNSMLIFSLS